MLCFSRTASRTEPFCVGVYSGANWASYRRISSFQLRALKSFEIVTEDQGTPGDFFFSAPY